MVQTATGDARESELLRQLNASKLNVRRLQHELDGYRANAKRAAADTAPAKLPQPPPPPPPPPPLPDQWSPAKRAAGMAAIERVAQLEKELSADRTASAAVRRDLNVALADLQKAETERKAALQEHARGKARSTLERTHTYASQPTAAHTHTTDATRTKNPFRLLYSTPFASPAQRELERTQRELERTLSVLEEEREQRRALQRRLSDRDARLEQVIGPHPVIRTLRVSVVGCVE